MEEVAALERFNIQLFLTIISGLWLLARMAA